MIFDLIILTFNSEKKIGKLLDSIKNQTLKPNEIIVIDSDSSDNTREIAKSYGCKVIKINKKEFDHGGTRSYAAKLSSSKFLIYLTDDVLLYNEFSFENLMKFFEDEKIAAVFGKQIPYLDTNIFGKILRYFNYPKEDYIRKFEDKNKYGIKTIFLSNSFCGYRKSALEKIGFFKEGLIIGEDSYVGARLMLNGYKIAYASNAIVYHSHNYGVFEEFKRYFDIGAFHRMENWILKEFGKAEGEGKRYILFGINFLIKEKKIYLLPEFFIRSFFKYIGYKLGYNYKLLPLCLIKKFSMHKIWWKKNNKMI